MTDAERATSGCRMRLSCGTAIDERAGQVNSQTLEPPAQRFAVGGFLIHQPRPPGLCGWGRVFEPQSLGVQCSSCWGRRSIDPSDTHHCAGCGCHGRVVFDVAVRMKQRRGLLTEPSPPQARSSRRRCDPGLRQSLTEEHGPVQDPLTTFRQARPIGFVATVAGFPGGRQSR